MHISTFKRGQVLLMKKMGILPPAAPVLSAIQSTYDAYFTGNLSPEQVETLDELFPATKGHIRASGPGVLAWAWRSSRMLSLWIVIFKM
jgi:hypothetical protein